MALQTDALRVETAVVGGVGAVDYAVEKGSPHPRGGTITRRGVNFSIYSEHASGMELLLFAAPGEPEPFQIIALDPRIHRTYHFWHCLVRDLKRGTLYAYRVRGPDSISLTGNRFNPNKVLIDPYSRGN